MWHSAWFRIRGRPNPEHDPLVYERSARFHQIMSERVSCALVCVENPNARIKPYCLTCEPCLGF